MNLFRVIVFRVSVFRGIAPQVIVFQVIVSQSIAWVSGMLRRWMRALNLREYP